MNKVVCAGILFASMMLVACGSDSATDSAVNDEEFSSSSRKSSAQREDVSSSSRKSSSLSEDVSSSSRKSSSQTEDVFTDADYLVSSYAELPSCTEKKTGQTGFVTGTSKRYICEDGEWVVETHNPSTGLSSGSSETNVDGYDPVTGILTDSRDGQKYKTTKIGDQVWRAQNLNYATVNSYCYDDNLINCGTYGRLYTWNGANKACPDGWHLPSKEEFETLLEETQSEKPYLSYDSLYQQFCSLTAKESWEECRSCSFYEFDSYGFEALAAGGHFGKEVKQCSYCSLEFGYHDLGSFAFFWASSSFVDDYGRKKYGFLKAEPYNVIVSSTKDYDDRYSVRCIKD